MTLINGHPDGIAPPRLPGALPLLGHGVPLLRDRLNLLRRARTQAPVVQLMLGPRKAYLINDYRLLHEILVPRATGFPRGLHFAKARAVAGDGIITASGPEHRRQRRMVLPAFSQKRVRTYAEVMATVAHERVSGWPTSSPIRVRQEFLQSATTVAARTLFTADLPDAAVALVQEGLPVLTRAVNARAMDPTGLLEKLPTRGNRQFREVMAQLDQLVSDMVTGHRAGAQESDALLGVFIRARDAESGHTMTDQQLRDEAISILLSSAETTALTMSWACHEVSRRPDVQHQMQAEVDRVIDDGRPRPDDLADLEYTRRVLKEVLRLYPPTYFLSRTAAEDTKLAGYRIPAGSTVLYSFYAQHRDPNLFRAPDVFDPDRWLPERSADVTPEAYLPFGEGVHRCVGEHFAWSEALLMLATIAANRAIEPVPGQQVRATGTVTLAPEGLELLMRPRDLSDPAPPAAQGPLHTPLLA